MATLRRVAALLSFLLAFSGISPAVADEVVHCWYESRGLRGKGDLVCRLAGRDRVVRHETIQPPPRLYPTLGYDATGECWYQRTVYTGFRITDTYPDGSVYLWFSRSGDLFGSWIDVGRVRGCDSEPVDVTTVYEIVWDKIAAFEFTEPDPTVQPVIGVTGAPTFLDLTPPDPVVESFASPVTGAVVEIEFVVPAVIIDWGDHTEEITPSLYHLFGPYPDGDITHVYETKDYYTMTIEYAWQVRWRFDGGTWNTVTDIPNTTWTDTYQVDELVGRITG